MGCTTSNIKESGMEPDDFMARLLEHYQPCEFPIVPVLNEDTQTLIRASWNQIINTKYQTSDVFFGDVSGMTFFYNTFFDQLFMRYQDFETIFSNVKARATVIGKVMSFCMSISIKELDIATTRLKHLGYMHHSIVHHPFLFGIYATTLHSTIKACLGENATPSVMRAWLHTLAWILRAMMPSYLEKYKHGFHGIHEGAVNSANIITKSAQDELKEVARQKQLQSRNATHPHSRGRTANANKDENIVAIADSPRQSVVQSQNDTSVVKQAEKYTPDNKAAIAKKSFDKKSAATFESADSSKNMKEDSTNLPNAPIST